ncbi:MAG: hypothetical protein LBR71_05255 [Synergistaceae bacterium]|jgi:hypothetical protein|nr:hypothetical protein [Synergistaceae bacterium]
MSKRLRPSLKDYLKTGEVRLEALSGFHSSPPPAAEGEVSAQAETPAPPAPPTPPAPPAPPAAEHDATETIRAFLELLSESDRQMWGPILRSGTEIRRPPFDAVALREDFRVMDRARFTYYILDERNVPLRPVRTSVQIREPFALLLKWDEMGAVDIYGLLRKGSIDDNASQ